VAHSVPVESLSMTNDSVFTLLMTAGKPRSCVQVPPDQLYRYSRAAKPVEGLLLNPCDAT
jgi:hypothetical protein